MSKQIRDTVLEFFGTRWRDVTLLLNPDGYDDIVGRPNDRIEFVRQYMKSGVTRGSASFVRSDIKHAKRIMSYHEREELDRMVRNGEACRLRDRDWHILRNAAAAARFVPIHVAFRVR